MLMTEQPLVSVLMTAFNREKYIAEAIESVVQQTYPHFELVIVDDQSKDRTVQIARLYASNDERIQVHVNDKNLGDYPNRNKAVSYAKGEFLVFVDSDDTIYPDALSYIVDAFKAFPTADFATIIDAAGGVANVPKLISSKEAIQQHFFERGFLHRGPGGTVVRKSFFYTIGCFPERYGPANDMYYNIKAASNSSIILLPYHFLFYREHEGQENKNKFSYLYNTYVYYNDLMSLPELPLSVEEREFLLLKSKRRFIVNLWKYFRRTGRAGDLFKAIRLAGFGFKDFLKGVFH